MKDNEGLMAIRGLYCRRMARIERMRRMTQTIICYTLWIILVFMLINLNGCTWKGKELSVSKIVIADDKIEAEITIQDEAEEDCGVKDFLIEAYPDDVIYVGDEVYIVTEFGKIEVIDNNEAVYREVGQ
jgi:hypothetical protein